MAQELQVERKTTIGWYIGDDCIVSQNRNGSYTVVDWHELDEERLRGLHLALAHVLKDIYQKAAAAEQDNANMQAVGPCPPPF